MYVRLPLQLKRTLRPAKLLLAAAIVAGALLYGGVCKSALWRGAGAAGGAASRRLAGDTLASAAIDDVVQLHMSDFEPSWSEETMMYTIARPNDRLARFSFDGLRVTDVEVDGPAYLAGLRQGQTMTHVNSIPVKAENVKRVLDDTRKDKTFTIQVKGKPTLLYLALNVLALLYMFLALSIVCDEYFVPALDVITEKLQLSPDVAGATFMAAGGSAPEFFTALTTCFKDPPSDVGVATIVGSAVFNVLFVIGACGIAAKETLQLTAYPLARDSMFYTVNLAFFWYMYTDNKIEWWEAAAQFSTYIVYCVFMRYNSKVEAWFNERSEQQTDISEFAKLDTDGDGTITKAEAAKDKELAKEFDSLDKNHDGRLNIDEIRPHFRHRRHMKLQSQVSMGEEPADEGAPPLCPSRDASGKEWAYAIIAFPLHLFLKVIPDVRTRNVDGTPGCQRSLYPITFAMSILAVAFFSAIMVENAEVIADWTEGDPRILAITILAGGTSVPDLLTSVLVTTQGHGDMAISSSIGSNIFDVTFGAPVPWFIYCCVYGRPVKVQSKPLTMAVWIGALVAMLVAVVMSIKLNKWVLNRTLGIMMLVLYCVFLAGACYSVLQEPVEAPAPGPFAGRTL